jgi:hypothetical protein
VTKHDCYCAGKFPVLTVQTIVSIAAQAERVFDHRYHFDLLMEQSLYAGDMGASPTGARCVPLCIADPGGRLDPCWSVHAATPT